MCVKVCYFFFQKAFHAACGPIFHEILYFADGHIQFPQQQDGFQDRALVVIIAAVSVFGVDESRLKQSNLIIPHKRLLVDAVHGRKLADGQELVFFTHGHLSSQNICTQFLRISDRVLTVQLLYSL